MTRRELLAVTPGLLLLNCSDDASHKTTEKPAEPITGLHALVQMYTFARTWAQDLKVIRLTSMAVPEIKTASGKAAAWQVLFSSESLGQARTYTFSEFDESVTLRKGIFADAAGSLAADSHSFAIGEATTDSDKASDIALSHGEKYAHEHPDIPISYILANDPSTGVPSWRIMWGASAASSTFSILVNARTGAYIRTFD